MFGGKVFEPQKPPFLSVENGFLFMEPSGGDATD
jgi:hypothetical protein